MGQQNMFKIQLKLKYMFNFLRVFCDSNNEKDAAREQHFNKIKSSLTAPEVAEQYRCIEKFLLPRKLNQHLKSFVLF